MTKYHMTGTSLAGYEIMMMMVPNFRPIGGGLLTKHKYADAGCACFDSRLTAGCRTHGELAGRLIKEIAVSKLTERTRRLLPPQTSSPFKDEAHRSRTNSIAAAMTRESVPFTAAVFLLSADPALWKQVCQAICGNSIDLGKISARGIGMDAYTLLQTAKDLYHGGCRLTTAELCDPRFVSDELFRLIISAFVIRRYGLPIESLR